VAASAAVIAFGWEDEAIEEAISFVAEVAHRDGERLSLSFGLAQGPMVPLFSAATGDASSIALGEPLYVAEALAETCGSKQLLVDGNVDAVRRGELATVGEPAILFLGSEQYVSHFCNLLRPWKGGAGARPSGRVHNALMAKVASLGGGQDAITSDVMLSLLAGKSRAKGGLASVRASLALSLAHASVGQAADALVEAMDALATARQECHAPAEAACNALLLKLFLGAGRQVEVERLLPLVSPPTGHG
jgi:hypothetical protein